MLMTSQLLIQTTKIFYSFFDVDLFPPTLKKDPPPMPVPTCRGGAPPFFGAPQYILY